MVLSVIMIALAGCTEKPMSSEVISQNDIYTVTGDSVIQGDFIAAAISPLEIVSNYQSPASADVSSLVEFRLSINSRDNEMYEAFAHYAIVGEDSIIRFGEPQTKPTSQPKPLPHNTKWTLRVDVSNVIDSLSTNGFFATATGDTIYAEDFKGIWVAGNVAPLTWDFENLYGKDNLRLQPSADEGIYEVTIDLNPKQADDNSSKSWKIDAPNSNFPQYSSPDFLVDALYNMAIDNIVSNVRPDNTYRAGSGWDGVWTRDVAYSTYLALAYLDPQRAMNSLKAKVKNDRIVQDTGTGGSWPVSSDRIVWAIAAWEIYKVTGDKEWLKYSYEVIRNSIEDDRLIVQDRTWGLMHGEQSYLDWRSQSYPKWMEPKDIFESMCLGTNVVFAQTFFILADMGDELGVDTDYLEAAKRLKDAINQNLWQEPKGYYSAYLYGGINPTKSPTIDNLGQALSVIWDIADDGRAESLIENTPFTPFGIPSTFPRIPNTAPYHNDAVWPFVQAFWNIAASRVGNEEAVRRGLGAMYRAAALFGTHKELFVASTGDYKGTAVNSDSQLWSAAGNVAMIFRIFAGMEFKTGGIEFNPFVPVCFLGTKTITGFHYRDAIINLTIEGTGSQIAEIKIDGEKTVDNFFPADMTGEHSIHITLKEGRQYSQKMNIQNMVDMPAYPIVEHYAGYDSIVNIEKGVKYSLVTNGNSSGISSSEVKYVIQPSNSFTTTSILPFKNNLYGFMSKPKENIPDSLIWIYQCEDFAEPGTNLIKGKMADKFVEISTTDNLDISIPVEVPTSGIYYIDVHYANGNGPINTDNKCAIRMLFVNTHLQGAVVMPQRGKDEWLNTGYSNMVKTELLSGTNTIQLMYLTPSNSNMNGDVNTALIDYIRIIKK